MAAQTIFAFDLDGTISEHEILPSLAHELGIHQQINNLTRRTLAGEIDFEESFRLRFEMLKTIPLHKVHKVITAIPLNQHILNFIKKNSKHCFVVTGNLDCWIHPLTNKLNCPVFCSRSSQVNGQIILKTVLRKDEAIKKIRRKNAGKIVAIGESANDIPMFQAADIGVAYAGVHSPTPALLKYSNILSPNAENLCAILQKLQKNSTLV